MKPSKAQPKGWIIPNLVNLNSVFGVLARNSWIRGLEFLSWLAEEHPGINVRHIQTYPPGRIHRLALVFCATQGYDDAEAFAEAVVPWLQQPDLWSPFRPDRPMGEPTMPLERYLRLPFHAVLLFNRQRDLDEFYREYGNDVDRLTRGYLGFYFSKQDIEGDITSLDVTEDLNISLTTLPTLILWAKSLRDHRSISLHGLSNNGIYYVLSLIVQSIREGKELPEIVASVASYISGRTLHPTTVVNYYINGNSNVSTGSGSISDYGGVQGDVNNTNSPRIK